MPLPSMPTRHRRLRGEIRSKGERSRSERKLRALREPATLPLRPIGKAEQRCLFLSTDTSWRASTRKPSETGTISTGRKIDRVAGVRNGPALRARRRPRRGRRRGLYPLPTRRERSQRRLRPFPLRSRRGRKMIGLLGALTRSATWPSRRPLPLPPDASSPMPVPDSPKTGTISPRKKIDDGASIGGGSPVASPPTFYRRSVAHATANLRRFRRHDARLENFPRCEHARRVRWLLAPAAGRPRGAAAHATARRSGSR